MKSSVFAVTTLILSISWSAPYAATTDGILSGASEYSFNTETQTAGYDKHNTRINSGSEYDDGSGGDPYDLNYLGFDIVGDEFQFGVEGGSILFDPHYDNSIGTNPLYLGDIAINILAEGEAYQDPTYNDGMSSGWDYAIRILDFATDTFEFEVHANDNDSSSWEAVNIYGRAEDGSQGHVSDTFRLNDGTVLNVNGESTFTGYYSDNGSDNNVLEGSFDLGLLSLFDAQAGGEIITYLAMSCVNDEAIVYADVSPVPLPASFWLFATTLAGFISLSRRTKV